MGVGPPGGFAFLPSRGFDALRTRTFPNLPCEREERPRRVVRFREAFGRERDPVGFVELPLDLEVRVVAGDRPYGVELDEMDVPTAVLFELTGSR